MPASENVRQLVKRFEDNRESYRSGKYNETQLRREFLDPFFEALGWDVFNKQGYAETYKDVIHEDSLEIEGENKAPDYAFRIGGARKFFVEAKKPAVNIESNIHPAFQLRRYAWSVKLPLSILTDFEEFAVYDCRAKPDKKDKASLGRIALYSFKDYVEKWDEIAAIFSREAVLKGSFDQYAEGLKGKKGTTEVDDAFLAEIERWRDLLAKNIALRNPSLNARELNYAVQITIDRIIFLRICEDRGVERDYQLKEIATPTSSALSGISPISGVRNGGEQGVYQGLCALFQKADARYNSGLFHFKEEKEQSGPADSLTLSLNVDDKVLQDILKNLYYPESPYVFREIPSDILGQVYERFLGKVIRLTAGHQAKVEEKPEVRKAGGVYYTPTYIVEYIVQNTAGKLLEGKTPKDVAKLKFLDPACGSGTFPLGAYQYLLDWHLKWYADAEHLPEKWLTGKNPAIYKAKDGYRLTTAKKKEILLNNIFGVDIDPQAVEVTKLSLLLKVLEGESNETIGSQLALFQERVLPDLGHNIKCGNSLIGPDYYEGHQLTMLVDEKERYRVNAFDWKAEFSQVFIQGGFDIVIGNPPYIQLSMAEYYDENVNSYFLKHFSSSMGRMNTFALFIDKTLKSLLSKNGMSSFIVPNTLLTQEGYQSLRQQMLKYKIELLTNFNNPVFKDAVVETIVFVVKNDAPDKHSVKVVDFDNKKMSMTPHYIEQSVFHDTHNNSFLVTTNADDLKFKQKLDKIGLTLKSLAEINQAIALKHDRSKSLFDKRKSDNYKPVLDGRNINRYTVSWDGTYLAYDVNNIHSCKRTDIFESKEKIFFRRVGDRLIATYDDQQFYALNTLVVINLKPNVNFSVKYLLGLINSKLLNFYYSKYLKSTKKVFSEIQARQLAQLPISLVNFTTPAEKAKHEKIVSLVERMLALHKRNPRTPQEQEMVKREIESTDRGIDRLVYELYGLSEEEIRIVEGN